MTAEDIIQNIYSQGKEYHNKAEYYRKNGELEGALINYLLSTSNLYNSLQYYTQNKDNNAVTIIEINSILTINIQYIVPLQEKLKQVKKNRNCPEDDKNEPKCTDVSTIKRGSIRFDDISGQVSAKEQIKQGILYPLLFPKLYPYLSKGILFYGPPGTGKTLLAKAFANELQALSKEYNMNVKVLFYAPEGGQLKGKYVGETEKNIEKYFNCASKQAMSCQNDNDALKPAHSNPNNPCGFEISKVISVIFLDEIEAIAGDRSRDTSGLMTNSVNALLQKMDGVNSLSNVVVMAATNYPWSLDDAILRRFDTKIYITLPTRTDIINLIKIDIAKYIKKILFYDKPAVKPKSKDEFSMDEGECNVNKCPEKTCCGGVCLHSDSSETTDINNEDIFNFYRKRYFPSLNDAQLQNIADLYVKNNFSGGDVSNALKAVFRDMGKLAFDQSKWVEKQIEKYIPGSDSSKKEYITKNSNEVYKFELYSNNVKRINSNDDLNGKFPDNEFALWFASNTDSKSSTFKQPDIDLQSNRYETLFALGDGFYSDKKAYTCDISIPKITYRENSITRAITSKITEKTGAFIPVAVGAILGGTPLAIASYIGYLYHKIQLSKSDIQLREKTNSWYNTATNQPYSKFHAAMANFSSKDPGEKNRLLYDIMVRPNTDFLYINWQTIYTELCSDPYILKRLIDLVLTLRSQGQKQGQEQGKGQDESIQLGDKNVSDTTLSTINTGIAAFNTRATQIINSDENYITQPTPPTKKPFLSTAYYYPKSETAVVKSAIPVKLYLEVDGDNKLNIRIKELNNTIPEHINRTWFIAYKNKNSSTINTLYHPIYDNTLAENVLRYLDKDSAFTLIKEPNSQSSNTMDYIITLNKTFESLNDNDILYEITDIIGIYSAVCVPGMAGIGATWSDAIYFDLSVTCQPVFTNILTVQKTAAKSETNLKWSSLRDFHTTILTPYITFLESIKKSIQENTQTVSHEKFKLLDEDTKMIESIKAEYNDVKSKESNTEIQKYKQNKILEKIDVYMNKFLTDYTPYNDILNIIESVQGICSHFSTATNIFIEWRKFIDYVYKMYDGNHLYKRTSSINILVKMDVSQSLVKTALKKYTIDGRVYLEFTFHPYKDYYAKTVSTLETITKGLNYIKKYVSTTTDDAKLNTLLETDASYDKSYVEPYQNNTDNELNTMFDRLIANAEKNQNSPDIFETMFLRAANIISYQKINNELPSADKTTTQPVLEITNTDRKRFVELCTQMHLLMNESHTEVLGTKADNFFNILLNCQIKNVPQEIYKFGLNELFYTDPTYITFMRAICHMYCNTPISELLEIGDNHKQLLDIMINRTMGNTYTMDIVNIKDYTYQNDTIASDENSDLKISAFKRCAAAIAVSYGVLYSIFWKFGIETSFLSLATTATTTATTAIAGTTIGTATGSAVAAVGTIIAGMSSTAIVILVLIAFGFSLFMGYRKGYKNIWNTFFGDKQKKFKQFKLCLMNNKLFGNECGFGTDMAFKINNECKSNRKYLNEAYSKCTNENFTIRPEIFTNTISLSPYIGKEVYGESYMQNTRTMRRFINTDYKKYNSIVPTPGGSLHIERSNVSRTRKNKNSFRKSTNNRNKNNVYQSGGTQPQLKQTATAISTPIAVNCPPSKIGTKDTEKFITLDFNSKMFMKVCSSNNPLKIKGTIDKCKLSILDKYHTTGSITEEERANKCNTTDQK
jgi:SpoVK/Ycf46/Vps4 family AAA+-type ATPase